MTDNRPTHAGYARLSRERLPYQIAPCPRTNEEGFPILRDVGIQSTILIRFEQAMGLNVSIEMETDSKTQRTFGMAIDGWERLVELVHQYDQWVKETP